MFMERLRMLFRLVGRDLGLVGRDLGALVLGPLRLGPWILERWRPLVRLAAAAWCAWVLLCVQFMYLFRIESMSELEWILREDIYIGIELALALFFTLAPFRIGRSKWIWLVWLGALVVAIWAGWNVTDSLRGSHMAQVQFHLQHSY